MSGEVKYSVRTIGDLIKELYNTYYFIFMVEDRDVAEAWIKAGITNVTNEYVEGDWRKYFEEVTVEEFAEESKALNNILLLPPTINGKPIRRGIIITKEPFAVLMFSDVNVVGFIVENHGDYEIHYLIFNGYDINTREERKLLIKAKAQANRGVLFRVTPE
jgi:hypothetical protein